LNEDVDILVEEKIIIELKSIEFLHDVHKKQLLTYLRLANKKLGILVNFNASKLVDKESIIRIIN
jgi:GxxExxY protein